MIPPPERRWGIFRPLAVMGLVVVAGIALVGGASYLGRSVGTRLAGEPVPSSTSMPAGVEVEVEIPAGASASQIGEILKRAGVVRSATQFEAAARTAGVAERLRAGRYRLVTGLTPDEVIEVLLRGPVVAVYEVTIPEGLRVTEILDRLAAASGIGRDQFEEALLGGSVTTSLRPLPEKPTLSDWEGLLFPDTYRFSENATAVDILARMASTMEARVTQIDWASIEDRGLTIYQGIIVASLIEAEVKIPEERPLVASVIYNRLGDGQRLEIDATVLYALGTRDPSRFDRSVDSPYNTYQVEGLPPTPIAAPGLASLEAAAAPADTDYRYYVLSSPDGRHTFSTTLEEHLAAVEKARQDGVLP